MVYVASAPLGVGGGVVIDHRLYGGEHGLAGEVGHIVVDRAGPQCACGARGCLTLYLGTVALAERVTGTAPAAGEVGRSSRIVRERAEAGDPRAGDVGGGRRGTGRGDLHNEPFRRSGVGRPRR